MSDAASTCSLDRSEQLKRLEEIASLSSRALLDARPTAEGARLRLKNTCEVQAELMHLLEAERECCAFLRFQVWVDDSEVALEVSGPPDARPLIDRLFQLPQAVA